MKHTQIIHTSKRGFTLIELLVAVSYTHLTLPTILRV